MRMKMMKNIMNMTKMIKQWQKEKQLTKTPQPRNK